MGWLRELLFIHETEGLAYSRATVDARDDAEMTATVWLERASMPAACEFKGVTYHGLEVTNDRGHWRARVILDV